MARWPTTIRIGEDLKLLVANSDGSDLIKARLPLRPPHPRALLTLLEGVALFSGDPVSAVISASVGHDTWLSSEMWGQDLWPAESPLVHFDFAPPRPPARRHHISGVGDFRDARRQLRLVWTKPK